MDSEDEEENFMLEAERKAKKNYLREEVIDSGYDTELFTQFFNDKTVHGDLDQITFDDLTEILRTFRSSYRPGQTLKQIEEENRKKEEERLRKEKRLHELPKNLSHRKEEPKEDIPEVIPPPAPAPRQKSEKIQEDVKEQQEQQSSPQKEREEVQSSPEKEREEKKIERQPSEKLSLQCQQSDPNELTTQENIEIAIKSSEQMNGGLFMPDYTLYTLLTLPFNWEVKRRYGDFKWLRELLLIAFPGVYIPPIPSRHIRGRLNEDTVSKREKFLDMFIKAVVRDPLLLSSPMLETFLKVTQSELEQEKKRWKKLKRPENTQSLTSLTGTIEVYEDDQSENVRKRMDYVTIIEGVHKSLKKQALEISSNIETLSSSLQENAGLLRGLVKAQELIECNESNSHFYGSLYELFEEWSVHELKGMRAIHEYLEDFFTYSQMESENMKGILKDNESAHNSFLKRKAKRTETQQASEFDMYLTMSSLNEPAKLAQDSLKQTSLDFQAMADFQIQHSIELHQIWTKLLVRLTHLRDS